MLALLTLAVCIAGSAVADMEYDKIFDEGVDVDSIIDNDRILDTYLKCFYSTGPCSSLAESVKGKITEVFSTVCGECLPKQKKMLHHTLTLFVPKRPDDWKRILEIYDPKGEYAAQMNAFISAPPPEA